MYKRILVPVDGSTTSDLALQEAIKLAEALKSQLHIVHIVDETPLYTSAEGFVDIGALRDALPQILQPPASLGVLLDGLDPRLNRLEASLGSHLDFIDDAKLLAADGGGVEAEEERRVFGGWESGLGWAPFSKGRLVNR